MSRRDDEFTDFVTHHRRGLVRAAYATSGSWTRAEDVVQNALARLYVAWPRVREEGALGYARRIVLTAGVDEWRRPWRREVAAEPEHLDGEHEDSTDRVVDRVDLVNAMRRLPARQRQVVVARFLCEMSIEETAHDLGLSIGTVKSHSHRALGRLNQLLSAPAANPI